MIKNILIPLDGSAHSAAAADFGLGLAKEFDAQIVLLGIINEPALRSREPVPLGGGAFKRERDATVLAATHHRVHELLEEFCTRCSEAGVHCDSVEVRDSAVDAILLEAQRCDLVVMAAQSHFTHPVDECCRTVDEVVKQTPRPVIVVPEDPVHGSSVVIAYDGSLPATRVLQAFQSLGLGEDRSIHVVSVNSDLAQAEHTVSRAVDFLGLHGLTATPHPVESSEAAWPTVLEVVQELDAGLLVMGSHGHSTFYEMLYGSWTKWTMKNTPVPLLVYH